MVVVELLSSVKASIAPVAAFLSLRYRLFWIHDEFPIFW